MAFLERFKALLTGFAILSANFLRTQAFDISRSDNDDTIDIFPLAFLNVFFSTGGLPEINLSSTCNSEDFPVFPGTSLANCQFLAADIQTCQAKGKIITLSLGGATGAASFTSDAQAQDFADTIWNLFLGGSSSNRPFGAAVLDGIDLDIEGGGTSYYASFVSRIRSHASGASKKYYVTAAPQCVYPDAYLSTVLNSVAFDAVYVQAWDFGAWDDWAKNVAVNKNVKIYIGGPAATTAAGSGYVDAATLGSIAKTTRATYSSFGGIMLWDASQAYANGRFDSAVKNAMGSGTGGNPSTTTHTTTPSTTTTKPTTTKPTTTTKPPTTTSTSHTTTTTTSVGTGNCANVAAWVSNVAVSGDQSLAGISLISNCPLVCRRSTGHLQVR
ncbi:hypothetical protein C0992_006804 [Termitomyces sp. T32_za158]|nr:hypothetical protein C0992_006804 [Termitomyces sp. T32_za158]